MATDGSGVQMFDGENFVHHSVGDGVTAGETFSIYADDFDNICKTKGECAYMEAKIQFEKEVLLKEDYYNGIIQCRVGAHTVKNLKN